MEIKLVTQNWKQLLVSIRYELVLLGLSVVCLVMGLVFYSNNHQSNASSMAITRNSSLQEPKTSPNTYIYIDIAGAVDKPNVYQFPKGTRLKTAIDKAVLSEDADKAYFYKTFNQAHILSDQEKIYIPAVTEEISSEETSLVNINTASSEKLDTLPGIGKITSEKIISARPYGSVNDLIDKKTLSNSQFEKIQALIYVE